MPTDPLPDGRAAPVTPRSEPLVQSGRADHRPRRPARNPVRDGTVEALGPRATCALAVATARRYRSDRRELVLGFDGYPATLVVPGLPDAVRDAINALALEALATLAGGRLAAGVWPGPDVIGDADRRILAAWRALKPDDGVEPPTVAAAADRARPARARSPRAVSATAERTSTPGARTRVRRAEPATTSRE